jgi:glucosylceramidase
MNLTSPVATTVLSKYVLPALAANNISTKVLLLDNNYYLISYPVGELADPTIAASSQIAGVAWHGYGLQQSQMQLFGNQYPQLGQYMTEHSGVGGDPNQFKNDFEDITAVMRNGSRTYLKWSLATNEGDGPETHGCSDCGGMVIINDETGAVSYPTDFYTLGHFSKFILPGATRIFSSNARGILTSAYLNVDGSKVLVAYNDSSSPQAFQVVWGSATFSYTLPVLAAATFTWNGTQPSAVNADATVQIQTSSYDAVSNLRTEYSSDTNGGFDMSFASDGSWAMYKDVNFGTSISTLNARVGNTISGASLEFHLDTPLGPLVATIPVPNTGGWQKWITKTAPANGASGIHDLYVVFRGQPSKLNWFAFN